RVLLVVAVSMDAYEIYEADDRAAVASEKAGAWTGALAASTAASTMAAPLLAGGPIGWIAYGTVVAGAGTLAYLAGGKVGEILYEAGTAEDFQADDQVAP
ncbi:MAG: hypothetical protein ACI9WU_005186, partial [Myxococcota bacterium]